MKILKNGLASGLLVILTVLASGALAQTTDGFDLDQLVGSWGEYEKYYDTSSYLEFSCTPMDSIRLVPRRSYRQVGQYYSDVLWLKKIVFHYNEGETQIIEVSPLHRITPYYNSTYAVPASQSGSCVKAMTLVGRADCKISPRDLCINKSVMVDVYRVK